MITTINEVDIEMSAENQTTLLDAIDMINESIIITTTDGTIEAINKSFEEITGFTKENLIGKNIDIIKYYKRDKSAARIICSNIRSQKRWSGRLNMSNKDGSLSTVEVLKAPIQDETGRIIKFIVISRDINHQSQLERQLYQAQKMEAIGTLASGIAHDYNNLLMTIQGYVSLMLLEVEKDHPHHRNLKMIEQKIQSGAELTSQLLGYARRGKYGVKTIDLNKIVLETSDAFEKLRKDITIELNLSDELWGIEADKGQIEQVLLNLFVNAADAMPEGGKICLTSENVTHEDIKSSQYKPKPGYYVKLSIRDTGSGIDDEIKSQIFEPFFTTKEMGRGTGLGLASVYGIVKNHNGYIEVDSIKKRGTVFEIYLPSPMSKCDKAEMANSEIIAGSGTILLVDDDKTVSEIGCAVLKKLGYSAIPAYSGSEAIKIYKRQKDKIDLVILDMIMPVMSGGEVFDILKKINPAVKVILQSGYSIDGKAREILNRGCNGFIQKPYGLDDLTNTIRKIL